MTELHRVKLEDFCHFLDEHLKQKYETQGLKGLRVRLQGLINAAGDTLERTMELKTAVEEKIRMLTQQLAPQQPGKNPHW